ncbi:MAG: SUMF1/EgtB/PvdO family nonheme iron enzyme [Magnetococcales bacterium]|nr:SUMF1/EgtB/PvdO family nonheme iron enzyme [Magnetococcales bacterium]
MPKQINLSLEQAERLIHRFTPGFRTTRLLGDGSFGQVFLAEDDHSQVAIKILPLVLRAKQEKGLKDNQEWQQLTGNWDRLNHASLVRNRAFFTYEAEDPQDPIATYGLIYMDYWSTDLHDCVKRLTKEGRNTPVRRRQLIFKLAQILLRLLEDTGLIVTDLKLENIMIGSCGQGPLPMALIDLGGIYEARLANYYRVITTDYYMAPELHEKKIAHIDEPILIYSFGLIGYFILEGRWPVDDYDYYQPLLIKLRAQGGLNWSSEVRETLPGHVSIIKRCLEESREDRFPTLHALVEALKEEQHTRTEKERKEIEKQLNRAVLLRTGPKKSRKNNWREPVTGLEFRWIPDGRFMMGQTDEEHKILSSQHDEAYYDKWFKRERPRHQVSLDGFWMAQTPITQGQFSRFIEDTLHMTDCQRSQYAARTNPTALKNIDWGSWNNTYFNQDDHHPVVYVSWFDCEAFIQWLSEKTGLAFSLPTEAQWEYACHGGGTAPFQFGANIHTDQANYDGDNPVYGDGKPGIYRKGTTAVGSFAANNYGLFDMHGNVWEWCLDHYNSEFYQEPESRKRNPVYRGDIGYCIKRGGSWRSQPQMVRAAYRGGTYPDKGKDDIGFRLILQP